MKLTRTQLGLIILLISTVLGLLSCIPSPSGGGMVRGGSVSPGFIRTVCISHGVAIINLTGIIILLSDARHYEGRYRITFGIALALFLGGFITIIAGLIGRKPYALTGNVADYYRMLNFTSIGAGAIALVLPITAWYLFKRGWKPLPVMIGTFNVIVGIGNIQIARLSSTLVARPFGEQIVYVPRFTEPTDTGIIHYLWLAGLLGELLLGGMWMLLLFAPGYTMQPRLDSDDLQNKEN
jgi:hypothetical protein